MHRTSTAERRPRTSLARGAWICLLTAGLLWPPLLSAEVVNRVVLRINERIVTLYDFLEARAEARDGVLKTPDLTPENRERILAELPRNVMRQVFQEQLLLSRADQMEIFVSEQEIAEEYRRLREEMGIESETDFLRAMQDAGVIEADFRRQIEEQLRMQQVIGQEVRATMTLEEDDLRRFYRDHPDLFRIPEQVQAREIVVLDSSPLDGAARQALATEIQRRLSTGEDMTEVAAEHAEDGRSSGVIDLGWVEAGDLDSALETALWDLEPGGVSAPVEGRGGLHILQALLRKESSLRPFNDVKDQIEAREYNRMFSENLDTYIKDLEQTAYIVENIPADAVGYRQESAPISHEPFKILGETPLGEPADIEPAEGSGG